MSKVKIAVSAAAISFALGSTVAAASADQPATVSTCLALADQVKTALASNAQSPNLHDAMQEDRYGREYCTNTFYAKGAAHYERALQLLGAMPKDRHSG